MSLDGEAGWTLEFHAVPPSPSYRLAGRLVDTGDDLEVLTGAGWVRGSFYWSRDPDAPPTLLPAPTLGSPDGVKPNRKPIPLGPGARCRWAEDARLA